MPLARPMNYSHSAAPDFFQNLIIAYQPIRVRSGNSAEQVIQRCLGLRLVAIRVNTCGKKTIQTKTASNARCGTTLCTSARLTLEMQGKRNGRRAHEGVVIVDRVKKVAKRKSEFFCAYSLDDWLCPPCKPKHKIEYAG